MADNIAVTPGTGATVATDDVSGVQYQRVKLDVGGDGATTPITSTGLPINDAGGSLTVDGTVAVSAVSGTIAATQSGTWNVTNVSGTVSLPTGAATSANQSTEITALGTLALETGGNLAAIKAKTDNIPAQGQALAAASTPVVLTASQLTTLTPPAAITGFSTSTKQSDGSQKSQVVDGSGNVIGATSNALDINIKSGNPTSIAATQSGTWNITNVSGTISLPTGAATTAKQPALGTAGSASTDVITIQGIASGTVVPISVASIPSHAVTNAGTFAVQESGTQIQVDDAAFTPATSKVAMAGFQADEVATDSVDEGDGGAARMTLDRKQIVSMQPHTQGGTSVYHLASAASTNATVVKNSVGQLYGYMISNTSAAYTYLAFHDTASTPTAGASVLFKIGIPAGGAANLSFSNGVAFASGIAITTVTGAPDSNSTGVALSDQIINLFYK